MKIIDNITSVNKENRLERIISYIVVHYTANNGDTALGNTKYFKNEYRGASAHYFVDEKSIYRCVNDNDIAWHCGGKSYNHYDCRNHNSIGIEMCSLKDSAGNYYFDSATIKNTQELIKELMQKYNISKENVIRHYDVTGKLCPAPLIDENKWAEFKQGIESEMTAGEAKKIIQDKAVLSDYAMSYLEMFKYSDDLLKKIAKCM